MTSLNRLNQQFKFIHEVDKIKYILRKTRLFESNRQENDAEHSWHLAMMTIVLSEYSREPIDVLKVLKMVLIHDIVEIDAGDVFFYDKTQNHDNRQEEYMAAERIFGLLPKDQAEELKGLWIEFEECKSNEAKFARVVDRLEPLLQNASNEGGTWIEYDVRYQEVLDSKLIMKDAAPALWEYVVNLLNESVEKGILKK